MSTEKYFVGKQLSPFFPSSQNNIYLLVSTCMFLSLLDTPMLDDTSILLYTRPVGRSDIINNFQSANLTM